MTVRKVGVFRSQSIFVMLLALVFGACAGRKSMRVEQQPIVPSISQLKYVNTYVLPHNLPFEQTTVGGLSGIDFDKAGNVYYLISDDRSKINPARFYKASIAISAKGIDNVSIIEVDTLRQRDGKSYPALGRHATKTSDPEAIRFHPPSKTAVWSSEGERIIRKNDTLLIDPTINFVGPKGAYIDSIPLPDNLRMHLTAQGPRRNGVLEGLTFADDYKKLFVSLEEPLFEDGPRAALIPNKAFVRFYEFDLASKRNTAQYAYELAPIADAPEKKDGEMINGVPDILWLGNNRILVTERSYTVNKGCSIKVFLADLTAADDIKAVKSMIKTPVAHPIQKKLLLDMRQLGVYIDNVEGATLGPLLANGHQSLIFVADNNFNKAEQTQFILFEIIP